MRKWRLRVKTTDNKFCCDGEKRKTIVVGGMGFKYAVWCHTVQGIGERRGTWRVRCLYDVTKKDQGLSSPRFHSETCGYSRAVIRDMLPLVGDLN